MTEQINVKNVPPELLKQAKIIAIQQNKTLSEILRELLQVYVREQEVRVRSENK